jgi:hypothetical protein
MKRVWGGDEAFGLDEELKKRVRGLRDEDGVAGVGNELEAVAVGFAGTGGEEYAIWGEIGFEFLSVVGGDCLTGGQCSRGLGYVSSAFEGGE